MTAYETFREVNRLASGTLARLFGTDRYDEIDAAQSEWAAWVLDSGRSYDTWQDAYAEYLATGRRLRLVAA